MGILGLEIEAPDAQRCGETLEGTVRLAGGSAEPIVIEVTRSARTRWRTDVAVVASVRHEPALIELQHSFSIQLPNDLPTWSGPELEVQWKLTALWGTERAEAPLQVSPCIQGTLVEQIHFAPGRYNGWLALPWRSLGISVGSPDRSDPGHHFVATCVLAPEAPAEFRSAELLLQQKAPQGGWQELQHHPVLTRRRLLGRGERVQADVPVALPRELAPSVGGYEYRLRLVAETKKGQYVADRPLLVAVRSADLHSARAPADGDDLGSSPWG